MFSYYSGYVISLGKKDLIGQYNKVTHTYVRINGSV